MMTNLFSIFDPSSSFLNLSLNWISSMIGLLMIPPMFWLIPSRLNVFWMNMNYYLFKEFKILLPPSNKGSTLLMISLFSMILFNNFMGLFPYIFTSSSHLIFTLTLSLPMWIAMMIFGWMNYTNNMFSHMIPQGTPSILMPFMVCIETISSLIRPMTLSIRLTANMIAGHLLMTLLSSTGPSMSIMFIFILIIIQFLLIILESAVAIIQSYVFSILMTLYSSEIK
uniref:ATP synthase subunit a n=1 Tax=Paradyschiria parvula TaxID=2572155 RepID=A0A5B9RTJ9_9MUSC|nr:ATP synthase F0 subunit 6 [Paradyschiria parvula]QEG77635.1 ATP synthase F0 subunit 6 [Paradyschiria parvula]